MTATRRSREDVIEAAGRLFADRGFHGTSMRDLGKELGLLGSSLYAHVEGKEELLVEVIQRGGALFLAAAAAVPPGPPEQRVRDLIEGHVTVVLDNLDHVRTFLNEARFLPEEHRNSVVLLRNAYEQFFVDAIATGKADGVFSADPRMGAIFVLSILNALDRWYRPGGRLSPEQLAEEIHRFAMSGLR